MSALSPVMVMSLMRFQKQIRLQEARRSMFGENPDVAGAGFRVNYEDPARTRTFY